MTIAPLAATTTASVLAQRLREAIDAGRWQPGELLRQEQIAAEYGVSRIPVREALFQLEAEGFVVTVSGRGTFVAEGREQSLARKGELLEKLGPMVQELRELGMTKAEWDALWEGDEDRA